MSTAEIALAINVAGIVFMAGISVATLRSLGERVARHEKVLHNGNGLVVQVARMDEQQSAIESKFDSMVGIITEVKQDVSEMKAAVISPGQRRPRETR